MLIMWRSGGKLRTVSKEITSADVVDNQDKAFIGENKTTPGFKVEKIQNKIALKVVRTV